MHPNVESSVNTAQGMQKANHDKKARETKYIIGENVMAKNFRKGPRCMCCNVCRCHMTIIVVVDINSRDASVIQLPCIFLMGTFFPSLLLFCA